MPATLLKSDSNTVVFQWILQNTQEHISYETSANSSCCCFFDSEFFLMFFWYNKVLSYPCSIKYLLWKPLLESRTLLKRHFIILEYCLQFSDNFLYGILRDFFVTKQYVNENNHWNMIAKKYFRLNKSLKESNLIRREETLLLCTIYCYIRTFILVIINATLFLLLWTMKCFSHLCNITGRL